MYSLCIQGESTEHSEELSYLYDLVIFKEKGLIIYEDITSFEVEGTTFSYAEIHHELEKGKPFVIGQKYNFNKEVENNKYKGKTLNQYIESKIKEIEIFDKYYKRKMITLEELNDFLDKKVIELIEIMKDPDITLAQMMLIYARIVKISKERIKKQEAEDIIREGFSSLNLEECEEIINTKNIKIINKPPYYIKIDESGTGTKVPYDFYDSEAYANSIAGASDALLGVELRGGGIKGIEECMTWLVNNPMKEIDNAGFHKTRYNEKRGCFEYYDFKWQINKYFEKFKEVEWDVVKEHYTFDQAKKDCMETGQKYDNYKNGEKYGDTLENNKGCLLIISDDIIMLDGPGITWVKID